MDIEFLLDLKDYFSRIAYKTDTEQRLLDKVVEEIELEIERRR